ncbi:MAG: AAA family ATPase [Elusimicrobia bacterium]|jgi:general secretion pathway protein A|nr:AAA family ATPase [Elusimicrobiota bacterium]
MYEKYWGLKEKPFKNTPEPKYLYLSEQHEEALARLKYGVTESLGCVLLSGVFGCGKTLLLRTLFSQLEKGKYKVSFVSNPQMSPEELLKAIVYKLGFEDNIPSTKAELINKIDKAIENNYNDGKETVVIIDEAHVINNEETFEELRMLLNFQKEDKFLITLILSGQPEITKKVNNIKQLAQRVGIKTHIDRMDQSDMENYIRHRLKIAGREDELFSPEACEAIYNNSGGIPRRVNSICDLSLLTGYTKKTEIIDSDIISGVMDDLI